MCRVKNMVTQFHPGSFYSYEAKPVALEKKFSAPSDCDRFTTYPSLYFI